MRGGERAAVAQVLVGDDLGADKPALHVAVHLACRLHRAGAAPDLPRAHFLAAEGGREGDQVEQSWAVERAEEAARSPAATMRAL